MKIHPIRTEEDYDAAVERIEALWGAKPGTKKADELDVLATLVDVYENEHIPIELPDPIAAIEFRMEQEGLEPKDLVQFLGQSSRVTEVLKKQRGLSLNMIRNLHNGLQIPSETLIQSYALTK